MRSTPPIQGQNRSRPGRASAAAAFARWLALAPVLLLLLSAPSGWAQDGGGSGIGAGISGAAKVIDGDTLEIAGESIRLFGIDAPESGQYCVVSEFEYPCGAMATAWLVEATLGRRVDCTIRTRDRWGRAVAMCTVQGRSLNEMIVKSGWAVAFRRYSHEFEPHEAEARRGERGMWRGPFVFPAAWRRGERQPRLYALDGRCAVKGNVTAGGEQIYHVEGGAHYKRLHINPAEGDRCFDTASDAADAGFRPASR